MSPGNGKDSNESYDGESAKMGMPNVSSTDESTSPASDHPNSKSWRLTAGSYMDSISDTINKHIAAARYGTMATIILLSAYGLSQTPLFSRFKTVAEIPVSFFVNRRVIRGRLIRIAELKGNDQPIQFLVFHLSPFGRMLSRSAFDFVMRTSPSAAIGRRLEENVDELLRLEIAGIQMPSDCGPQHVEATRQWLDQLAAQKALVTCQLLARRVAKHRGDKKAPSNTPVRASVVDVTALRPEIAKNVVIPDDELEQTAVCKLSFRNNAFELFPTDVAFALVRWGYASPAETLFSSNDDSRIIDTSTQLNVIKEDNRFLKGLEHAEFEAAKEYKGMWADPTVREKRKDLIDEVDFQTKASIWKKLWRWIRG